MERPQVFARCERLTKLPTNGLARVRDAFSRRGLKPISPHEDVDEAVETGRLVLSQDACLKIGILAIWPAPAVKMQEDIALGKIWESRSADVCRVCTVVFLREGTPWPVAASRDRLRPQCGVGRRGVRWSPGRAERDDGADDEDCHFSGGRRLSSSHREVGT